MLLLYKCTVLAWPVTKGYSELVDTALGSIGGTVCTFNFVVNQIMFVATYLVFIGDNLKDVFGGSTATYIMMSVPPIVGLCLLRDMRALGPASAVGTAALLLALCLVLQEGCSQVAGGALTTSAALASTSSSLGQHRVQQLALHDRQPRRTIDSRRGWPDQRGGPSSKTAIQTTTPRHVPASMRAHKKVAAVQPDAVSTSMPSISALGTFAGISIFTFAGHSEVVPVVLSFGVAHPRHAPYSFVSAVTACIAIPATVGFSVGAVRCFADAVRKNILLSVHTRMAALLKALMAISALLTCPIKMFPASQIIEAALALNHQQPGAVASAVQTDDGSERPHHSWMRTALRMLLVLLAASIALACPDFEFLVAFMGAFCEALFDFVLPPLMFVTLRLRSLRRLEGVVPKTALCSLTLHALLCALGVAVWLVGTFCVVREKMHSFALGA